MRLLDLEVASESCPAGNDDDDDDEELDDTKEILQAQSPLQSDRELVYIAQHWFGAYLERDAMHEEGGGQACKPHSSLVPTVDLDLERT